MNSLTSKVNPIERRRLVALAVANGKSNREIAKQLNVDEGTIRGDRKKLVAIDQGGRIANLELGATVADLLTGIPLPASPKFVSRPSSTPPKRRVLPRRPGTGGGFRPVPPERDIANALQDWLTKESLRLRDIEFILEGADSLLAQNQPAMLLIPLPSQSPVELFAATRSNEEIEDYMPAKLEFFIRWVARWLAACSPGLRAPG